VSSSVCCSDDDDDRSVSNVCREFLIILFLHNNTRTDSARFSLCSVLLGSDVKLALHIKKRERKMTTGRHIYNSFLS
jgi:hypothetical protein